MEDPKSFAVRCKAFFGLKEGQTLGEFAAEIRSITPKDKEELIAEFERIGLPVLPPV